MAKDVKVFDGTKWESIVGPPGPPGPTRLSEDVDNCAEIGSDGLLHVPALPLAGGTVAGLLSVTPKMEVVGSFGVVGPSEMTSLKVNKSLTVTENITSQGLTAGPNTFPSTTGNSGDLLSTNGSGTLSWVSGAFLPLAGGTVTGVVAFQQAVTFQSTVSAVGASAVFVINNTANAADARRATLSVTPDGVLAIATTGDSGSIQGRLRIDRSGTIQAEGASLGTFPPGSALTADMIAEDVAIGTKGMFSYGPVNLNSSTAVLNVTNAAGQFNLNCVSGLGVTQGQYRIQAQTTGAFRIFDVTAGVNRISWAATTGDMTVPGNTAFQGATNTFRQASINSEALGPMNIVAVPGALTLDATHAGKALMLSGDAAAITLPASLAIGTVVELIHNAPTYSPSIVAGAGATLAFNVRNTYYTGASVQFSGRLTSVRALKTNATQWLLFGSLANPTV